LSKGGTGESVRPTLDRIVNARSIAVVGVSETSRFAAPIRASLGCGAEFFFVHPRAESIFGYQTYPDLHALDRPVDVVYSAVGADRTVDVAEAAAAIGAGGLVTVAGGFAEFGEQGRPLQQRLLDAAATGNFPVVGPNGVGMIHAGRDLNLTVLPRFERRPGGLSVATHSGAMVEAIGAAAWRSGGVGLNVMFSAGNEAVTDLADYLTFFADDPGTRVIALVVEKIRRPEAFFHAVRRCLEAGKPILALKLGRTERAQRMAVSHTGTLTGDTWVYDVAFQQSGIILAEDIDDVVNRAQFLEQLPRQRWTPVRGLAVLTVTGGFAQLASDLGEEMGVDVPDADRLTQFVAENVPGAPIPNPLDATGFVSGIEGLWAKIVNEYAAAPEFDALLFASQHADWDTSFHKPAREFVDICKDIDKTSIIAPLAGVGGAWLDEFRSHGVAVGNGLRGCFLGLQTMGTFMRLRPDLNVASPETVAKRARPAGETLKVAEGEMLSFADTMQLLAEAGIPTAPYALVDSTADVGTPDFAGPYVVKLADVAHRTEHRAVRVGVTADELGPAAEDLRAIARADGLPAVIAIQPMVDGHGEAFIGINGNSELGPVVAFGLGGIFVELLKRIGGRMAPMTRPDAIDLISEFDNTGVLDGFRGAPRWDRDAVADTLVSASLLAASGRDWIDSIDINPLIITASGPVAVDGLCLLRPRVSD
jgi:acyl-CoA synthetase (NDP forming)